MCLKTTATCPKAVLGHPTWPRVGRPFIPRLSVEMWHHRWPITLKTHSETAHVLQSRRHALFYKHRHPHCHTVNLCKILVMLLLVQRFSASILAL